MKTLKAIAFASAHDAIQHSEAQGGEAIRLGGKNLVAAQRAIDRLACAGVPFAYLGVDESNRLVTVPVN